MGKISVIYSYPISIASIILQNSKVHMYNYLYKVYPRIFGNSYKVLYMDTDSIYAKLNITEELKKVLTKVLKASPINHLVSSLSFYFLLRLL